MASASLNERLAMAAHLHVLLRRKHGRVTDTEWMAVNEPYARFIIDLARAQADDDLDRVASRFEEVMFGSRPSAAQPAVSPPTANRQAETAAAPQNPAAPRAWSRYVGGLR